MTLTLWWIWTATSNYLFINLGVTLMIIFLFFGKIKGQRWGCIDKYPIHLLKLLILTRLLSFYKNTQFIRQFRQKKHQTFTNKRLKLRHNCKITESIEIKTCLLILWYWFRSFLSAVMAYFVQIKNLYEYHDDASALHLLIFSQPYKQQIWSM